eukprot:Selendium_serpulae@DN2962_c0_g1_i1.p1
MIKVEEATEVKINHCPEMIKVEEATEVKINHCPEMNIIEPATHLSRRKTNIKRARPEEKDDMRISKTIKTCNVCPEIMRQMGAVEDEFYNAKKETCEAPHIDSDFTFPFLYKTLFGETIVVKEWDPMTCAASTADAITECDKLITLCNVRQKMIEEEEFTGDEVCDILFSPVVRESFDQSKERQTNVLELQKVSNYLTQADMMHYTPATVANDNRILMLFLKRGKESVRKSSGNQRKSIVSYTSFARAARGIVSRKFH